MSPRLSFRLPFRFLRGTYGRLSLTVLALACGVALVCATDLVNRGVLWAFGEIIDTMAGRAALQVDVEDGGWFPEELAKQIAAIHGVERAIPVVSATVFTVGDAGEALAVHGFDLTDPSAVEVYGSAGSELLLDDALALLNRPDAVIVTREFARRHQLDVDSTVVLDTAAGRQTFTVRGLIEPEGIARAYGGNLLVMDIAAAQQTFTRPGMVNRIDVVAHRDAVISSVAEAIARSVPSGLRVGTPAQRKADLQSVIRSLQILLQALSLIALAAAFLISFNRLSAVFEERTWQIGTLRAGGARRSAVCIALVQEGLILGALGVILGAPAGIVLGRVIFPVIAATTALNYRIFAPPGMLDVNPYSIVLAAGLGLGTAVLAALLPAWRTSGISVAATVRTRGQELPDRPMRALPLARIGVLAVAVAAVLGQWLMPDPRWGLAATVLLLMAAQAVARPLLQLAMAPMLGGLLRERLGVFGGLLQLGVARRPRRTASAVAMVAIGMAAVVWLGIVAVSFERTTIAVFEQSMRADLVVSSAHIGGGALEMPVDERFGEVLRGIPGVRSVAGIRLANWEYEGGPIVLDAFDPEYFRDAEFGQWPLLGEAKPGVWEAVAAGRAVVVSSNFVRNLGVAVGDTIHLDTPRGTLSVEVAGITTDFASPRGTIEMSRQTYAAYWNDPMVTRFFVETDGTRSLADVRAGITSALAGAGKGWRVISSGELVAYWGDQVRRAFASVYVLGAVIFVVILFGLVDNLNASVVERTRELGMLRALGARRRRAAMLVVLEAGVISIIGLLLALGTGVAIAALWVSATIPHLLGWVIDFHLPLPFLMATAASTLIACLLAALVPGRRAARLDPAVALRSE